MFGLMKRGPRLPYCGTCKTLGAMYGQRSRLLLNHDIAFLAEALLDVAGVPLAGSAYRSFNCLTLPSKREDIPAVMQYAAAVTVALANFRIADHRRDGQGRDGGKGSRRVGWKLAGRILDRSYLRAARDLRGWGFPLDEMAAILATQPEREANAKSFADVAEPTMISTAMVFSHGVGLAGRPDRSEDAWRLGYKFGELIYLLDAFEDRRRDARNGDFNPLLAFPETLSAAKARDEMLAIVSHLEQEMTPAHAERLRVNVEERLGLRPRVLQGTCREACRKSARERARDALAFARALRDRDGAGLVKGAFIIASVGAVALVFPEHARRTDSWQQCLGVSMNLMALGTVFAGAPPPPPSSPPPPPPPPPPPRPNSPPDEPMQFRRARPDMPGTNIGNFRGRLCGGCKDECAGECLGSLIESACDSACDS